MHHKVYNNSLPTGKHKKEVKRLPSDINKDYITLNAIGIYKPKDDEEYDGPLDYMLKDKYDLELKRVQGAVDQAAIDATESIREVKKVLLLGRNVCLYGHDSKIKLLDSLIDRELNRSIVWKVQGYFPAVTQKNIYFNFGQLLVNLKLAKQIQATSMRDQLEEYRSILSQKRDFRIVVVFYCLDGPSLLNSGAQRRLSELFSLPGLQLLCSVDNMKIVTCWSPNILANYKLEFHHVRTGVPLLKEFRFKLTESEKEEQNEKSLLHVWTCLNENQKKIMGLIAENELENERRSEKSYYTKSELLDLCIEEIILSSEVQLRTNLMEMIDHKVLLERVDDKNNRKVYYMAYSKRILEQIANRTL